MSCIFTRRRSFAEYWKYFMVRFNDVHAFGYNSAGSERILMKFGELRVYYYKKDIKLIEGVQRRATNRKSICTKIGDLE